jgi:hypothetical protein
MAAPRSSNMKIVRFAMLLPRRFDYPGPCPLLQRPLWLALVLLAATLGTQQAPAGEAPLPTAEAVIEKCIEARGGRAAHTRIRNIRSEGTIEITQIALKGKLTVYEAEPNYQLVILNFKGADATSMEGTDGRHAWKMCCAAGPSLVEGVEKATKIRHAAFHGMLRWKQLYRKGECVGVDTVNEKPCYKVILTPPVGAPEVVYFDKDSGLEIKRELLLDTAMGKIAIHRFPTDYRETDGILLPRTITYRFPMAEQVIRLEKVETNLELPRGQFDPPPEVIALLHGRGKPKRLPKN